MIDRLIDPTPMLRLSWVGLWAGVVALVGGAWELVAALLAARGGPVLYALTPQEFTAWITAIAGGIGALAAALNGVAVVIHKIRQLQVMPPRPRRRRKGRPEGRPDAGTEPTPNPVGPDAPVPAPG